MPWSTFFRHENKRGSNQVTNSKVFISSCCCPSGGALVAHTQPSFFCPCLEPTERSKRHPKKSCTYVYLELKGTDISRCILSFVQIAGIPFCNSKNNQSHLISRSIWSSLCYWVKVARWNSSFVMELSSCLARKNRVRCSLSSQSENYVGLVGLW